MLQLYGWLQENKLLARSKTVDDLHAILHATLLFYLYGGFKYCHNVDFATSLNINWVQVGDNNHWCLPTSRRWCDISSHVADKSAAIFAAGCSPSSALETYKCDLHMEDDTIYSVKAADRYFCLDLQWCYHLYYKLFRTEYDMQSGSGMTDTLMQQVETWNAVQERTVAFNMTSEHVIAICTSQIKWVHQVLQSSELMFMYPSGCMDTSNYRVIMLMTSCSARGLPLAMFITMSESESALLTGLEL